jgi:polyisoprenoid-binding protein YceI
MISKVRGHFRDFDATLIIDEEQPERSRLTAQIDVASIDTSVEDRDTHLRSDDFFGADQFPKITFKSTQVERGDGESFRLTGDLTIRDITREVVLEGKFEGRIQDPWGKDRAAFSASVEISRKDFNVRWNQVLEAGGVTVGDKVKISLHIEAVREG